ncbi:GLPGLI family protein [uncultured Chryseobacterium sp.]|uniref:GLPGLI family protein n=1 Tax=uncultured Chryseobacterium sp. TaxID=259322 RepID=UPI0025D3D8E9|nr:GLPGLI family protein [uncultured Chryseobacterium sp.]
MKKICIFLLLSYQLFICQNKRLIYEYKYVPDSTKKNTVKKEMMVLDLEKNQSIFYSQRKYISDSTLLTDSKKGKLTMPPQDLVFFYKIKKLKDSRIIYETSEFDIGKIAVEDDRIIKWNISDEKSKILGYPVQKATSNIFGRNWIAWFTTALPFSDGPYKFKGLPGLIVKISDSGHNHIFELVNIENIAAETPYPDIDQQKQKNLSLEAFRKYYRDYRNDPASGMRQQYIQGKIPDQTDTGGNFSTGLEIVRRVEKLLKERIKKDNNVIELDMIK